MSLVGHVLEVGVGLGAVGHGGAEVGLRVTDLLVSEVNVMFTILFVGSLEFLVKSCVPSGTSDKVVSSVDRLFAGSVKQTGCPLSGVTLVEIVGGVEHISDHIDVLDAINCSMGSVLHLGKKVGEHGFKSIKFNYY